MNSTEEAPVIIEHSRKWDRAGLIASGLCLVHCLVGPVALLAYPSLFQQEYLHGALHLVLLPLVVLVAFLSFVSSYKQHLNKGPIFLGSLGILLLLVSFFMTEVSHSLNATIPAIFGSLILIGSHLWNIQACRCFCEKSCSHTTHEHL